MPFGAVVGAVAGGVASSATSSLLGGGSSSAQGAAQADPFASQRGQYQDMLSRLISDPSSITSQPGYQFQFEQGQKALSGQMAAQGFLTSGNRATALTKFGQDYASNALQNQELLLAQLAGANIGSPGTAGQITAQQGLLNQQAASAVGNQVGGALNNAVSGWMGGGQQGFTMPSGFNTGVGTSSYNVGGNTYSAPDISYGMGSGLAYGT